MKQLEVQIMGQSYLLACPEGGEAQMRCAVEKVDTAMTRIRDAGKVKARDRIAVLAALNLAFEHFPATLENPSPGKITNDDSDPRLSALLERLDHALARDDRLL